MLKKNLMNLFLICMLALQLGACGKDESENQVQNTPPPIGVADPYQNSYNGYYYNAYNNLPNYGSQQIPAGSYWYYGQTNACPYGYTQSGSYCILSTTQYNTCSSGMWNGWTCVPTTFSCPVGYQYNWWGVCIGLYSYKTSDNDKHCQKTAYFGPKGKRKKHCVYTYTP